MDKLRKTILSKNPDYKSLLSLNNLVFKREGEGTHSIMKVDGLLCIIKAKLHYTITVEGPKLCNDPRIAEVHYHYLESWPIYGDWKNPEGCGTLYILF